MPIIEGVDDVMDAPTGFPVLAAGKYEMRLLEIEEVANTKNPRTHFKLKMGLEQAAKDVKGNEVPSEFPFTFRYGYAEGKKASCVAEIQECFLGRRMFPVNTDDLIGQIGTVTIEVVARRDKDGAVVQPPEDTNELGRLVKKAV